MSPEEPAAKPPEKPKSAEKPKPSFHIYARQKDQHVVGDGCWCMPQVEFIDGHRIVIHKRD